jgi:mRNA interferase RelE/StbE
VKTFTVQYRRSAEKDLESLPAAIVQRVRDAIRQLAENPRPHGCLKLKGYDNKYRIRVGDFRVLYEIHEKIIVVLIIEITHRKDVYR